MVSSSPHSHMPSYHHPLPPYDYPIDPVAMSYRQQHQNAYFPYGYHQQGSHYPTSSPTDLSCNQMFPMPQIGMGDPMGQSWHSPVYSVNPQAACSQKFEDSWGTPQSVSPHSGQVPSPGSPGMLQGQGGLPSPSFTGYKFNLPAVSATATATAVAVSSGHSDYSQNPLGGSSPPQDSTGTGTPSEDSIAGHQNASSRPPLNRSPFEWMKKPSYQQQIAPGKTRTKDKYRVVYTDHQRLELEKEFHYSKYITIRRKSELAAMLGLSERQVKIWFQNRRAKERKQAKKREEQSQKDGSMSSQLGPPPMTTVSLPSHHVTNGLVHHHHQPQPEHLHHHHHHHHHAAHQKQPTTLLPLDTKPIQTLDAKPIIGV